MFLQRLTSIGCDAFSTCLNLEDINIPHGVTYIGYYAFFDCISLTSIEIPEGVTRIDNGTFNLCEKLVSITIPESVTEIGYEGIGVDNFDRITIYGYEGSYAESYSERFEINFVALPKLVDSDSGVSVMPGADAELSVKENTDKNKIDEFNTILSNEEVVAIYDITLTKDGVVVQPDGKVTVKIPTDNENAKVYRVEDDGTLTDMNAIYSNGFMVFTTDHFSLYVLAIEKNEPVTPVGILGDANGDEKVNVKDATLIQKYAASLEELDDTKFKLADVNADTKVNVKDATAIQKYAASIETGYPIGEQINN